MKRYIGQGMGKGRGASLPSTGAPLSQHFHMFTNLETPWTPVVWIFMEASIHSHG